MSPADAGCLVSLIKNLELQLSLGDVEELVKLMKNISNEITRETGATTKPRNSVRASLSKNVDQTKFGSLANAFAIIFVEVFEVGTLAACDWEIIETALECIVAAKHVRDFELLDWVQEEEARKAREAEALKEKENAEKAEQEKLKQQHIMRLQEIREVKKQCERDEAKLVATCRESSSSHYVDGAPKPADLFRGDTPEMKKPKNDYHAKLPSGTPESARSFIGLVKLLKKQLTLEDVHQLAVLSKSMKEVTTIWQKLLSDNGNVLPPEWNAEEDLRNVQHRCDDTLFSQVGKALATVLTELLQVIDLDIENLTDIVEHLDNMSSTKQNLNNGSALEKRKLESCQSQDDIRRQSLKQLRALRQKREAVEDEEKQIEALIADIDKRQNSAKFSSTAASKFAVVQQWQDQAMSHKQCTSKRGKPTLEQRQLKRRRSYLKTYEERKKKNELIPRDISREELEKNFLDALNKCQLMGKLRQMIVVYEPHKKLMPDGSAHEMHYHVCFKMSANFAHKGVSNTLAQHYGLHGHMSYPRKGWYQMAKYVLTDSAVKLPVHLDPHSIILADKNDKRRHAEEDAAHRRGLLEKKSGRK
ncbi:unnamed protein product [Cladocopium goreaui]|uniref:DNA2/NAM7 helicase helicase domain-containing protein n=1 Tax=Cladocopium goreaui TaxID=2562237 RepID=A0A9P1GAJ2_9DINO|nr:unnamed protein product [Cladocopium goreaui]